MENKSVKTLSLAISSCILFSTATAAQATALTTYTSATALKAAWVKAGAECMNSKQAKIVTLAAGRSVQCAEQDSIPMWFSNAQQTSDFAKQHVGTDCIRGKNWVIYSFAYPGQSKVMRTKLKASFCS